MVTLLILLILFVGAYSGYKMGIILKLLQTIGYVIVFIFTMDYYKILSEYLYLIIPYPTPFVPESNPYYFYDESLMFSLDYSYYDVLSFLAIIFIGWAIVKFITKFISYTLEVIRVPEPLNGIGGAVLGFIINYLGIFAILFLLTTIPYDFIQNRIADNTLAANIVTSTPVVSEKAYQTFILDVNEEVRQNQSLMDIESKAEEETTEENAE